jgi:uncharacterized protein DUF4282
MTGPGSRRWGAGPSPPQEWGSEMLDFLKFETMITPILVEVLFWLAVVFCVIVGIISMVSGKLGGGLALFVLGPIGARIYAELLIVFFRMNDHLRHIQVNTTPH